MTTSRFASCAIVLLAASCGARRAAVAEVYVAAPPQGVVQPASQCTATLSVGPISADSPTCTIDERVSGRTATLTYGCEGGPAEAAFGESVFRGALNGGILDIAIETRFPFSDGCTWLSKQRISGPLGALAYSYEERPDVGQSGCSSPCLAQASAQLR